MYKVHKGVWQSPKGGVTSPKGGVTISKWACTKIRGEFEGWFIFGIAIWSTIRPNLGANLGRIPVHVWAVLWSEFCRFHWKMQGKRILGAVHKSMAFWFTNWSQFGSLSGFICVHCWTSFEPKRELNYDQFVNRNIIKLSTPPECVFLTFSKGKRQNVDHNTAQTWTGICT